MQWCTNVNLVGIQVPSSTKFPVTVQSKKMSQYSAFTPIPNDWTVVDESVDAGNFNENEAVIRCQHHPPTSPISTNNEMSLTFFSERDSLEIGNEPEMGAEDVVVNDPLFQVEALEDAMQDLKKSNDELTKENEHLRCECTNLLKEVDRLKLENVAHVNEKIHKNHEIARLKLRVGKQGRLVHKYWKSIFRLGQPVQHVGYGSFLNGREVFWRKASQTMWDEDLHSPLFGHADPGCNFVLLHRCDAARNSDEDTLVHAVGCHVTEGTMIKFQINNENAYFGF